MLLLTGKTYDAVKKFAQVVLPAVGTLYFTVAQIWGLGHAEEVVGTIVAVDTFLGVALHLSSTAYNNSDAKYDGTVEVTETADKKTFNLILNGDPHDIDEKKDLTFKVAAASKPKTRRKAAAKKADSS